MLRLGITGGIGSGKSYVARVLNEEFGIPVYDCDTEAKRLNVESSVIREGIRRMVGPEAYFEDGSLNRPLLAKWLFESDEHAKAINALVHPLMKEDWMRWSEAQDAPIVALESAILYSSGFDTLVDKVLLVDAPRELRLKRAIERDNASREQIEARMARQNHELEDVSPHFMVVNDGRDLLPQLRHLMSVLT